MIAIETRYAGPTNRKPGRIIATTANDQRLIVSWERAQRGANESGFDCRDTQEAPHRFVATELANEFGWLNDGMQLAAGSTKRGYVFVFVDSRVFVVQRESDMVGSVMVGVFSSRTAAETAITADIAELDTDRDDYSISEESIR